MDTQRSLNVVASPVRGRSTARCRARPRDQPLDVLGRVHVQNVLGGTIAPLGNDYQRSTGSPWLRQRKIHHLPKSRGCRIASTLIDVSFLEGFQRPISLSAARCSTSRCGSCARKHGMQAVDGPARRPRNSQSFREGSWRSTRCGSGLDDRKQDVERKGLPHNRMQFPHSTGAPARDTDLAGSRRRAAPLRRGGGPGYTK
jgi:hypothetical protein